MKLGVSVKYQTWEYFKSLRVYYPIVLGLYIAAIIVSNFIKDTTFNIGGIEVASTIFIFVMGLNSFKDSSRFMLQNGVSRAVQGKAILLGLGLMATVMVVIDTAAHLVFRVAMPYTSLLEEIFVSSYGSSPGAFEVFFSTFLWKLAIYCFIGLTGLFVTTLYVRINKGWKIAVSISVLAFFLVVTPIFTEVFHIRIFKPINDFLGNIFGINPFIDALNVIVFGLVLSGIVFLMMRRATFEN